MIAHERPELQEMAGRMRGVLERAEWGTRAERTKVAWALLEQLITAGDAPRLALARALAGDGFAVVRDVGERVRDVPLRIPTYEGGWNECRRAMLAAGQGEHTNG